MKIVKHSGAIVDFNPEKLKKYDIFNTLNSEKTMTEKVKELSDKIDGLKDEIHQLKAENVELRMKLDENKPNQ